LYIANREAAAVTNLVVRELFDPSLVIISSSPAPDPGTIDRWSIPFLPANSARTITIVTELRTTILPGSVIRNFATLDQLDPGGAILRSASATEDTLVVAPKTLTLAIDDLPDPVMFNEQIIYAITYANLSNEDLSGVAIYANPDETLDFDFSSPAPDGDLFWYVGTVSATSAGRILAAFDVDETRVFDGDLLPLRAFVTDEDGHAAAETEVTLFTVQANRTPFQLSLSGAPRNLRIGVVTTMLYVIKLRNVGVDDSSNVVISNILPAGLEYSQSTPAPTSRDGNVLTYNFASLPSGGSKQIVIEAELGPGAEPGTSLVNRVTAIDAAGNFAEKTFSGGVRSGPEPSAGRLQVSLTTVRRVLAGSKLKSTIGVTNGARGNAENVVVTLDGPAAATIVGDQTFPSPTKQEVIDGQVRWTWVFPTVKGPGNESIKTTHIINENTPAGTSLNFTARVSAADGRKDDESKIVEVRD
jgi:uncharacterized repeat protein (TIGR01451 family)